MSARVITKSAGVMRNTLHRQLLAAFLHLVFLLNNRDVRNMQELLKVIEAAGVPAHAPTRR